MFQFLAQHTHTHTNLVSNVFIIQGTGETQYARTE